MIDKRPRLIAQCVDSGDVITAVNFGREHGLAIAVRGGGHNGPGFASVDNGLVIDLSLMNSVRVSTGLDRAFVEGGATWADVDAATTPFGRATPGGRNLPSRAGPQESRPVVGTRRAHAVWVLPSPLRRWWGWRYISVSDGRLSRNPYTPTR